MNKYLRTVAVAALVLVLLASTFAPATAQTGNMWQVNFWPNPDWAGNPTATSFVSTLTFDWGEGSPMPGIPSDNFTARATTSGWFAAGTYNFSVQADDEASLAIDGIVRVSTFGAGMSGKTVTISMSLAEGWHTLQVDYREFTGLAYLFVTWSLQGQTTPPSGGGSSGGPLVPVPSATTVVTQYGDYTPCIEQNIHQKFCFVPSGAWDSPNYGSIEMEPQIVFWGNCVADTVVTMQLYQNQPAQPASCSKTEAGYYPI
jgi:hypothetical protein